MKIIINIFSEQYSSDISLDLIPLGIEGIEVTSNEEVYTLLKENICSPVLITENYETEFIERVKEICPFIHIILIIGPKVKPADLITLTDSGIKSIIYHNNNIAIIVDEIFKNINADNIKESERRTHIRVKPKYYDKLLEAIYIKNHNKFITGSIQDISAGGFAVKIQNSIEASMLVPNNVYDPVLISIQGKKIHTLSFLIAIREDTAGFKFENIEESGMRVISSFIHTRIFEDTRNLMKSAPYNNPFQFKI